jgi:hypothetical protein
MTGCGRCGQEHRPTRGKRACKAHRSTDSGACTKAAMLGQEVCASHGGKSRQNRAAGQRRETERKATAIMQTYGRPIDTNATEALLDEVKWTAGYVAWLREQVGKLDEAALIWGKTKTTIQDVVIPGVGLDQADGTTEEAKPHIYRQMLLEERRHLVDVCKAAISAGIEERRVHLAEQQGALVADVIKRILDALHLTPQQLSLVPEVVPTALRLLTA